MEIISNTLDFELHTKTAVALGKFDGLHIGHRKLLEEIIAKKKESTELKESLAACVLTFDPSPAVLFGLSDGREILTREEKRQLLSEMGVDILVEFPMTKENAAMEPEVFVEEILVKRMHTKWIAAGKDVSFGKKGAGNEDLLRRMAEIYGYEVATIDKLRLNDVEVSSSYVRGLIDAGKMEEVSAFLGAPYVVMGTVEHGKKLGRKLGMPTVNLIPSSGKLMPPNGVYFSKVAVKGQIYNAISNIGYKPTVSNDRQLGIESYLYDFDGDIYGENIRVYLYAFERPEMRFESVEELKEQMSIDIAKGREYHRNI